MSLTAQDWVDRLHADYLARGKRQSTWDDEYWKIYKRLPLGDTLTRDNLHALVIATPVNTRSRVRVCMSIGVLARFAGVAYDPSPYRGNYSPKSVKPRDLPADDLIVQCYTDLKNPAWRWAYGMIAAYGLRPHEVFRLDLDLLGAGDPVCHVGDNTKTGFRRVWAYHPEWFEQFALKTVTVPPIKLDRENRRLGESAAEYFHETARLPFTLYNLRHAWAVRATLYGLQDALAAQQMGHSLEVHNSIYQKWIGRAAHQAAYEATLNNPLRPKPPSFPQ
jgi:integrase